MEKFWLIWNPVGRAPSCKHPTEFEAIAEAERLAKQNPGQEFITLEAHDVYRGEVTVARQALADHQPPHATYTAPFTSTVDKFKPEITHGLLLIANHPDHQGVAFSAEALRAIAESDPARFWIGETGVNRVPGLFLRGQTSLGHLDLVRLTVGATLRENQRAVSVSAAHALRDDAAEQSTGGPEDFRGSDFPDPNDMPF